MTRSAPWAAVLVGLGALGLILYRVLQGNWTMPLIVGIGVVGALVVLLLWALWDRRVFTRSIRRLTATGEWDVVVGGYLVQTELKNIGVRKPRLGETVLAAGEPGIRLFDPRQAGDEPVLRLAWSDLIDLAPGTGEFLRQPRDGVVLSTLSGRLLLVLRTDERRGIMSVGSADTGVVIDRIRRLRPNARFE